MDLAGTHNLAANSKLFSGEISGDMRYKWRYKWRCFQSYSGIWSTASKVIHQHRSGSITAITRTSCVLPWSFGRSCCRQSWSKKSAETSNCLNSFKLLKEHFNFFTLLGTLFLSLLYYFVGWWSPPLPKEEATGCAHGDKVWVALLVQWDTETWLQSSWQGLLDHSSWGMFEGHFRQKPSLRNLLKKRETWCTSGEKKKNIYLGGSNPLNSSHSSTSSPITSLACMVTRDWATISEDLRARLCQDCSLQTCWNISQ